MRELRESRGWSQAQAAELAGVRREMWAKYEAGAEPGAKSLAALAGAGWDVLYILTGNQSAASNQLAVAATATKLGDRDRLAAALGAVEEGLAETKRRLAPNKKAELILAAYDLMAEPEQSRANVIRLVRMAA